MDEFMGTDIDIERSSSFTHKSEYSVLHPIIQVSLRSTDFNLRHEL